ncbi:hypothetical protein [Streptomyces sp. NPDC058542]|uniref:hypothetical protein n=1 Tax=Streptomyces sp. NPDC058542 TaxID=3346543 RepID=UPI00365CD7AA
MPPDSRLRRVRRRYRGTSTTDKIALWALVVTAIGLASPAVVSGWQKVFPEDSATLLVEPNEQACLNRWYVPGGDPSISAQVARANPDQLAQWVREGRAVHAGILEAAVTVHGDAGSSVEVRDISVTVTHREKGAPGTVTGIPGCGSGPDEPSYLAVDLDTLPLNQPVPAAYLLRSPQQKAARQLEADQGQSVSLPHTIDEGDFYSLFLIGRTERYDTRWKATITWWDGKDMHRRTLSGRDGKDLRVVPTGDNRSG